jgi:hypothetical protein
MRTLSQIAAADLDLGESPRGSNRGPELRKFFTADDLEIDGKTDGYPWCAAAVSFWTQTWIKESGSNIKPPRIAAVRLFPSWADKNGLVSKVKGPKPNDIVVFTFSHIGIVESVKPDGSFVSIEGNTNDDGSREGYEVARRSREASEARLFITLR